MATYEFTYKVPDELYVNSWDNAGTATAKVKLDDPIVHIYMDTIGGPNQMGAIVGTSLGEFATHDSWEENRLAQRFGATYSVSVDASKGGKEALAAWLAKYHTVGRQGMDSDEYPQQTYTSTAVPVLTGKTYEKLDNPMPSDYWLPHRTSDESIEMAAIFKGDLTHHEINTLRRREEVRYYRDKYDLGDEAESDAKAFIAASDAHLAKMYDVKPWMDDGTFKEIDSCKGPRIPISVVTGIDLVKDMNYVLDADAVSGMNSGLVSPVDQIRIFGASLEAAVDKANKGDDVVVYSDIA